jgi:predicted glycosyltransferase
MDRPLHVLVAPLDWGLGHATRCIPIIRYLLEKKCTVTLAAEGPVAVLLRSNFPDLNIVALRGYRISYSKTAVTFAAKILLQIPKILGSIKREKLWLGGWASEHKFDLVISDNRYGLKIAGLYSVIMTHQLQINSGQGPLADRILKSLHYPILEKFDECWVVDQPSQQGLGGKLSHPDTIPVNAKYLGLLSQLNPDPDVSTIDKNHILVLLSGPEPMRSILEEKIFKQAASHCQYSFTIVAGNPSAITPAHLPDHISYKTHLNAPKLKALLSRSALVICRSGYSTLMDLAIMRKKALLIPTPGQAEQEYLGDRLREQGLCFCQKQADLNLENDIARAFEFPGFERYQASEAHQHMHLAIDEVLSRIRLKNPA